MKVEFRTNIDCCKGFVSKLSELDLDVKHQPLVGDRVLVHKRTNLEIWLKVVSRNWFYVQDLLVIDLHLEEWETIIGLERRIKT